MEKELYSLLWSRATRDFDWRNILIIFHKWMRVYGYSFSNIIIMERILRSICRNSKLIRSKPGFAMTIHNLCMVCAFCRDLVRICPNLRAYPFKGSVDVDGSSPRCLDQHQIAGIIGLIQFYTNARNLIPTDDNPYMKRKPLRDIHHTLAHVTYQIFYERFFYCIYHLFKHKLSMTMASRLHHTLETLKQMYEEKWFRMRTHNFAPPTSSDIFNIICSNKNNPNEIVVQLPAITQDDLVLGLKNYALIKLLIENITNVLVRKEKLIKYVECDIESKRIQALLDESIKFDNTITLSLHNLALK